MEKLTVQIDGMTVTISVETITPAKAKAMLAENTGNRKIVVEHLKVVKKKFLNGEWEFNGESIKISEDGRLLDGQHRLTACVETGVPFSTLVVTGLLDDTQETMDDAARRTPGQLLTMAGTPNGNNVAAMANAAIRSRMYGVRGAMSGSGTRTITRGEILAEARSHMDDYQRLSPIVRRIQKAIPVLAGGAISVLVKLFESIDYDDATFFWDRVTDGQNLSQGEPIYELRKFYQNVQDGSARNRDAVTVGAVTIKAWNAYRRGDSVGLLRFRAGGHAPEQFPEAI